MIVFMELPQSVKQENDPEVLKALISWQKLREKDRFQEKIPQQKTAFDSLTVSRTTSR